MAVAFSVVLYCILRKKMKPELINAFKMLLADDWELKNLALCILRKQSLNPGELLEELILFIRNTDDYKKLIDDFYLTPNNSKKGFACFLFKHYYTYGYNAKNKCLEDAIETLNSDDVTFE